MAVIERQWQDWYAPLRERRSLGSQAARPGSLAGLHEARRAHLSQFFTPDDLAGYLWRLVEPAMARALKREPGGRIPLFDNSVGTGRLFQYADPEWHTLSGVDVHEPSVAALAERAEAAGFEVELLSCGMEAIRPRGYAVGLLNPPFSIRLESPLLEPLPCTTWGRFGPGTSAISHAYAIDQALEACDVVVAIVPRGEAEAIAASPERGARLYALLTLPEHAFEDEGTRVETAIVAFGRSPRKGELVRMRVTEPASATAPDLGLECRTSVALRPRLRPRELDSGRPSITLPVTHDRRVRLSHDGRWLRLRFYCGLTEAKVRNALLGARIEAVRPSPQHRYPKHIAFDGQGKLDLEVHLIQADPMASFQRLLGEIREAGGEVQVDPGIYGYLRRRIRQDARRRVPLGRVVRQAPGVVPAGEARIRGRALHTHTADPKRWISPLIEAGTVLEFHRTDAGRYRYQVDGETFEICEEEFAGRFEIETRNGEGEWVRVHPGRSSACRELARMWRARAEALGIHRWLTWDFQMEDLVELMIAPGGAIVAWEMGLGKARLAAALCLLAGHQRNLICVKPHLIPEMVRELEGLPIDRRDWQVIRKPGDLRDLRKINVIAYTRLRLPLARGHVRRTYARALRRRIGLMVSDEGHLLANWDSLTSRALRMVSAKKRYVLTGTPIPNYPRDILPLVAFVSGDATATQPYGLYRQHLLPCQRQTMRVAQRGLDAFRERHVSLEWVTNEFCENLRDGAKREIPRIKDLAGYREWLGPHIKRRVTQEPDVAAHVRIPVPSEYTRTVRWDPEHLGHYLRVAEEFASWYRDYRERLTGTGRGANLVTVLARIQAVERAASVPHMPIKGFGAYTPLTSKQRYVLDRLEQLTREGHKSILYASSPAVIARLAQALSARGIESVCFHGERPILERTKELDERYRFGPAPVLLASLGVTQDGLNIPQANRVIYYDRAWSAKTESQAGRRVLRPQQQRAVEFEYVHLAGSIDEYKAQMVAHKADAAAAGLDYGTPELDGVEFLHLDTLLGRFCADLAELMGCQRGELRDRLVLAA